MATLATAGRNAAADAVATLLNAGHIRFETSGAAEIATCVFGNPAFGSAVAGVATANAITADTTAVAGTIANARARKSDDTDVFSALTCTTSGGGGDIICSSLSIGTGDTVSVSSFTITVPAS